jgi:hypothetical protein
MTSQEIDAALFREELAEDTFFYEPSPANKWLWLQARDQVDRAIREAA